LTISAMRPSAEHRRARHARHAPPAAADALHDDLVLAEHFRQCSAMRWTAAAQQQHRVVGLRAGAAAPALRHAYERYALLTPTPDGSRSSSSSAQHLLDVAATREHLPRGVAAPLVTAGHGR